MGGALPTHVIVSYQVQDNASTRQVFFTPQEWEVWKIAHVVERFQQDSGIRVGASYVRYQKSEWVNGKTRMRTPKVDLKSPLRAVVTRGMVDPITFEIIHKAKGGD